MFTFLGRKMQGIWYDGETSEVDVQKITFCSTGSRFFSIKYDTLIATYICDMRYCLINSTYKRGVKREEIG